MSEIQESKKRRGRPRKTPFDPNATVLPSSESKESNTKTITDPLIEPYYVSMDQYCYTVFEKIIPENEGGKDYFKSSGHYSNFGSCLDAIAKRKANNKSYTSIREFIDEYTNIINTLNPLRKL